MGIADMFGLGKKKIPFKIPDDVLVLRTRIEAENRENYPNLARYQEIVSIARTAYKKLDVCIAQAEYSEEAVRIKEDIEKKMARLKDKINKNKAEASKEGDQDYVESNMEYLERKSRRNQAKTLFTECLESFESIITYFKEERLKHGTTLESATGELIKAMATLNNDFFKHYGEDKEIKEIREKLLKKIQGLVDFFEENKVRLKEKGLEAKAQSNREEILRAAIKISDKFRG